MKKIVVRKKSGQIGWATEMLDPTDWIADCTEKNKWGKPERWVLHKDEPMAEAYDDADVLEEKTEQVDHSVSVSESGEETVLSRSKKMVKLKAEYTIEIEDITAQHALAQVIASRKAEYPSAEEFLNAYFDGGQAALDVLAAARLAVKAKYPKP